MDANANKDNQLMRYSTKYNWNRYAVEAETGSTYISNGSEVVYVVDLKAATSQIHNQSLKNNKA